MPKTNTAAASNVIPFKAHTFNWTNPDTSLLDGDVAPRPAFPTHLLGKFWAEWVDGVAASKNVPADYVGASLITLAAALIGNARKVEAQSWAEPPILWTVLVGNPSAGKSPAMDPFVEMIAEFEAETAEEFVEDEEEDSGGTIHIDDVTAQAAAEVASQNPKGLILTKDELSHWWSRLNQTGGEGFWLKAYGARPETVKRKGKSPLVIRRLAINVLGGAQPTTLQSFVAAKENKGFAARWLYVFPRPVQGFRIAKAVDLRVAQGMLRRLWKLNLDARRPIAVPVTPQAISKFVKWVANKKAEARTDEEGIWGQWLGKQGGVALRLALVIEHLWWISDAKSRSADGPWRVSTAAMTAAMTFIDTYAAPMAAITLNSAVRPTDEQDALQLVRLLHKKGESQFNARLLGRGSHGPAGRLSQPSSLCAACEVLEAASLIRHIGERADGKKGRRPSVYQVNPALLKARL
ncbi:YfjI family protein [Roseibacterium beibuensis]|uniref:YfjI family protein n=1 Tax=[Roseibacterium] beibuensis TaxID=1193142 RepID=UPI00217DA02E|nr:YfjI family protein [Roseibacterium beibuensis]MCS6627919.1 YfjI family protein [Roseibacterium beibuensis]